MRVGSNVKSDNFTACDTPITHTQHASMHMHRVSTGDPFRKVEPISPGQDPDFDKQHADTHRGMRWPPHGIDSRRWTMCVCDRCV